jgi:hypothetical protein
MAQSEAPPQKPEQTTGGVGIALGKELVITTIVPDSAAARNKAVRVGERVIAVAEIDQPAVRLQGKSVPEAVSLIRGAKGTTVRLTLVPAGKDEAQARDVILMRGELNLSGKGVPLADVLGWGDGELLPAGSEAPNIQMTVASGKRTERWPISAARSWCSNSGRPGARPVRRA